jgi:hypothetical protein
MAIKNCHIFSEILFKVSLGNMDFNHKTKKNHTWKKFITEIIELGSLILKLTYIHYMKLLSQCVEMDSYSSCFRKLGYMEWKN